MASLVVTRPGMLTTVQDLGRWGHQGVGVPVAGPMDWYSHRLANLRAGNADSAAALEITLMGPELEADGDVVCAAAGARFHLTVNGRPVGGDEPFTVKAGERLRFGERIAGSRAVLAVQGGFAVDCVLGSRSTSLVSRMGPFGGRALRIGDVLPVRGRSDAVESRPIGRPLPMPPGGARLHVVPGPNEAAFSPSARTVLAESRFMVTAESNRMGYRLQGPALERSAAPDLLSAATPIGSVQVPASGQPILLMADRQTTGGYARIATVITADIPLAGQLAPGDWVEFSPCSRETAIRLLREREASLQGRVR